MSERIQDKMTTAYIQAFSGASGDMFLGALADLGWPVQEIKDTLQKVGLPKDGLHLNRVTRGAFVATSIDFSLPHEHSHRGLSDVVDIIVAANLPDEITNRSISMFERLARAEATVHGLDLDKVHFHEVGALDSILDIVGASAGLAWLNANNIVVSPINTGGGTAQTQHGVIPIPGPATLALLKERSTPVYSTTDEHELLTPTGALILTESATSFGPMPAMKVNSIGLGAGQNAVAESNVLRIVCGTSTNTDESDMVTVIETNIDDASPQSIAHTSEVLFASGALDVFTNPIFMKKGRIGTQITVISLPEDREKHSATLFKETTTLGIRYTNMHRNVLPRRSITVGTKWGNIRVKLSLSDGAIRDAMPEYDDCHEAALKAGVSLHQIMSAARMEAFKTSSREYDL